MCHSCGVRAQRENPADRCIWHGYSIQSLALLRITACMDMHVHAHIIQFTAPHREGHPRQAVSGRMCPALMLWTVHLAAGWDLHSASN